MGKILGTINKYCFECGRLIPSDKKECPYCHTDLKKYRTQEKVKCRYCGRMVPDGANHCRYCHTKNISKKTQEEDEVLSRLKTAADLYQARKEKESYNKTKYQSAKSRVWCFHGYGCFEGARSLQIKTGNYGLKIQTLNSEDEISWDDFISCHRIGVRKIKEVFGIPIIDSPLNKMLVISTAKGNLVLGDNKEAEDIVSSIYYHLSDCVVEFMDCFYNASHDQIFP